MNDFLEQGPMFASCSRRDFLKLMLLTAAGAMGEGIIGTNETRNLALAIEGVWKEAEAVFQPWGSYQPKEFDLPHRPEAWQDKSVTLQYVPAASGRTAVRLAEGLAPALRFVDDQGICFYPSRSDQLPPREDPLLDKYLTAAEAGCLIAPEPKEGKELTVKGDKIKTVVVRGDSWGAWGGNIYSIGSCLDLLFKTQGYKVEVKDICSIGSGVTDFLGRPAEQGWQEKDTLHIFLDQPDTDHSFDVWKLTHPPAQVDTRDSFFSFWKHFPKDIKDQLKASAANYAQRQTQQNLLAAVVKLAYQTAAGRLGNYCEYDEAGNQLHAATALSPLDPQGRKFFEYFLDLQQTAFDEVSHAVLVGLPTMGLSKTDNYLYNQRVWPDLARAAQSKGFPTVNTNHYDNDLIDPLQHPFPQLNLEIAGQIMHSLTGEKTSRKVLWSVAKQIDVRVKAMEAVLKRAIPGQVQALNYLLPLLEI